MVVLVLYYKIDLILICYVGNNFRICRNTVSGKVDRLAVHSPAVEDFIRRRFGRGYGKQTVLIYHLHVVNASVILKRGDNLFAAFERSQILLVITYRFLQFGDFCIERAYYSRVILRLQRKIGNLIIQARNLRVQPVYGFYIQFVVRLQLFVKRLQIIHLACKLRYLRLIFRAACL